jgi:hypothetical protein
MYIKLFFFMLYKRYINSFVPSEFVLVHQHFPPRRSRLYSNQRMDNIYIYICISVLILSGSECTFFPV